MYKIKRHRQDNRGSKAQPQHAFGKPQTASSHLRCFANADSASSAPVSTQNKVVLPCCRQAVGRRVPILMDGGIRRGTDVLKVKPHLHKGTCKEY